MITPFLRFLATAACAVLLCILAPATTEAAINPQISFQGKLTNLNGTNVTDGNYSVRFRIYTDPSADTGSCTSTCKWEETHNTVAVSGGLFHVNLGSAGSALPGSVNFDDSALYLGIKVGSDVEMTPRVQFTAAPYAFNSDMLDGLDATDLVQLSPSGQQTGNINVSGTITSGAVNGITVGSTIQPSSAGALTIQSNGANALTLTSGAAATWSTTTGLLTMQGAGGVTINTPNVSGASSSINIQGGNSSSGTAGNVSIDTGTTSTGTPTVNIGATNARAVQIGNNTSNPSVTITSGTGTIAIGNGAQARTITIGTGAAAQTITIGSTSSTSSLVLQSGTGNLQLTTQGTGTLGIGNNAVAQTIAIGNATGATTVSIDCGTGACNFGTTATAHATTVGSTNGASTLTLQSGTGNLNITTQGSGQLNIGNNATAQTINIGNATGATAVSVLCGTGACGFGNNAIAHTTTIGSNTGAAATILQAGTGGLSLTSAANIVLGASDTTGTLLVLDSKTNAGDPTGVNGGMYYNSSSHDFRAHQNSNWATLQPLRYAFLTADRTNSTTTYADATDLSFSVAASTNYEVACNLIYQTAATTTGIGFALNGPATPGLVSGQFVTNTAATTTGSMWFNAYNGGTATTGVQTANSNTYGSFKAYFRNGTTAGTLQLRYKSEVASSNAVVKANSYCTIAEL